MQNSSSVRHETLAIIPAYNRPYMGDRWTVNFKWVARGIIQHIDVAERKLIGQRILQAQWRDIEGTTNKKSRFAEIGRMRNSHDA